MGVFTINEVQKKILLEYLYNFIFGIEFLFLFLLNNNFFNFIKK